MKALHFSAKTGQVKLIDAPKPTDPAPNGVIIQVAYCGVCGTDLHVMAGEFPAAEELIMGHEISGKVTAVGAKVQNVKIGDKVTVNPGYSCGECKFCCRGLFNYCVTGGLRNFAGFQCSGGWAEFIAVPSKDVHVLPEKLSLKHGVLCEPMSCITRGFDNTLPIPDDAQILVMGAGIAGLLWSSMFHHYGYKDVTIAARGGGRQKIAENIGLGYKVCHLKDVIARFESPDLIPEMDGYNVIIDCTGNPEAIESAFPLLRQGGILTIYGCCPKGSKMSISPAEFMLREAKVIGTCISCLTFPKTTHLVAAMADKYFNFEKLGVRMYSLEHFDQAFTDLRSGIISKAVFKIGGDLE